MAVGGRRKSCRERQTWTVWGRTEEEGRMGTGEGRSQNEVSASNAGII